MNAIVVTDQAAGLETVATIQKAIAALAVFIIEPGPTSTSSRETDPFGVRNQQASEAGRKQ
jgi:hypothetical protein